MPFTHAARDFARAEHLGRKRIIHKELEHYNRDVWLFRHVELHPSENYLSSRTEMYVRYGASYWGLRAIRDDYAFWKTVPLYHWASPEATRAHHLDCLKTLYHGEARKLLNNRGVGELLVGAAE